MYGLFIHRCLGQLRLPLKQLNTICDAIIFKKSEQGVIGIAGQFFSVDVVIVKYGSVYNLAGSDLVYNLAMHQNTKLTKMF